MRVDEAVLGDNLRKGSLPGKQNDLPAA